ncbi:uncharacterized protein LOC141529519 [Cotesia typhae]|uniref:uncharacterized protein LOC141529519 n=1 Tax=Cotesia typhae TaxID=2053667 RepID=UPI003D691B61
MNNFTESRKSVQPTNIPSIAHAFKANMAKYMVDHKINHVQGNALLKVLKLHPQLLFLPDDCRSLLKTPRDKIVVKEVAPGEYIHLGLEEMLQSILNRVSLESIPDKLLIDFSTDGAELNKEIQLWPIQFRVVNLEYDKPELAGVYKGEKKPRSFADFFSDFVQEFGEIMKKGGIGYKQKKIPIEIRCFIADAPARASVLNHRGHIAKVPCSKCHIEGSRYSGSNRYPGINYKLRSDVDYRSLKDVDHHEGKSALYDLPIDLVQQVPFDYMHLVCLGVMKKTIESLVFGKCKPRKLPSFQINMLSTRLANLQLHCPREFARNLRELDKLCNFKATEFRQLLLYTFIVVFHGIITDQQYSHFLLLHSSMRVLLSNSSSSEDVNFAEEAVKNYVIQAEDVHGLQFLTYNAHGLLHLAADYRLYGALDSVSAFAYENRMPIYRNYVRKPDKPLQQIFKRVHEELQFSITTGSDVKTFNASGIHNCGPITSVFGNRSIQYENLQTPSFYFSIQNNDNTIISKDGRIGIIKNIILYNNSYYFADYYFEKLEPLYMISNDPSTKFGVYQCSFLNDNRVVTIAYNDIQSKCYRMPLWVKKLFSDYSVNDKQLNNTYVAVTLSCSLQNNFI